MTVFDMGKNLPGEPVEILLWKPSAEELDFRKAQQRAIEARDRWLEKMLRDVAAVIESEQQR